VPDLESETKRTCKRQTELPKAKEFSSRFDGPHRGRAIIGFAVARRKVPESAQPRRESGHRQLAR
jgi:hypothetical protein